MSRKKTRRNVHFRQTPSSFKGAKQARIYGKMRRLNPIRLGKVTGRLFVRNMQKLKSRDYKLPKFVQKGNKQ